MVTHQCSYLCHIIQTVENILSCFLRLNPRLCLMIIWCLLKTGDRHWPELPCNQLWVMCHFQLQPYPALIRDHCVSLAWPGNIYTISATVIWQLLCHTVIYLFFFHFRGSSQLWCESQRSLTPTPAWGSASHPYSQKPTGLSPWGPNAAKHTGTRDSGLTWITISFDCQNKNAFCCLVGLFGFFFFPQGVRY